MRSKIAHHITTMRLYNEIFQKVVEYIDENYASSCLLSDFVRSNPYSPRSVQRGLEEFNTSWTVLLIERRMEVAEIMLVLTDDPIKVVAKKVGYNQSHQFARTFRNIHQMSPTEYRDKYQGEILESAFQQGITEGSIGTRGQISEISRFIRKNRNATRFSGKGVDAYRPAGELVTGPWDTRESP